MEELPFRPYTSKLKDVLLDDYMIPVARWMLGPNTHRITVMAGGSTWETAFSFLYLMELNNIFSSRNVEHELQNRIKDEINTATKWLISEKRSLQEDGKSYLHWENVTWDTSVILRALASALHEYPSEFSEGNKNEILKCLVDGNRWLLKRFSEWDTQVKYPFGPADVSQIGLTILKTKEYFPDIYENLKSEWISDVGEFCPIFEIMEYLLYKKTEKTLTVKVPTPLESDSQLENMKEEHVVGYWWDDYFSTAEVVEGLAELYSSCFSAHDTLNENERRILNKIPNALVHSCVYFEHDQIDGMWGSHIDTLKVLYAYVRLRRIVPQRIKIKVYRLLYQKFILHLRL